MIHLVYLTTARSCGLGTVLMVAVMTLPVCHYLVARALSAQYDPYQRSRRSVWSSLEGICLYG